jgi:hypothetical protein
MRWGMEMRVTEARGVFALDGVSGVLVDILDVG